MPFGPNEPTRESLAKENTYTRAVADRLKSMVSTGLAGRAADAIKSRPGRVDAEVDATTDPTSVEYGGQRGQADRTPFNRSGN